MQSTQRKALDLTCIADDISARHGPAIQKKRLARSAGGADLSRSASRGFDFERV